MTQVSVIICTYNRADSLRRTLAAITDPSISSGLNAEVIVVDNGSTDNTASVVQGSAQTNLPVRYVLEKQQGQSRARNRGMAEARGEIIVFTDDDVLPARDWLIRICAPIIAGTADAVVGSVTLAPHLDRPWMSAYHRAWLADTLMLDRDAPGRMVGANMAFSRAVLGKVPAFDVELGPGALGFGDDTLFSQQLKTAGYRIAAAFEAKVEHHFAESRLTPARWNDAAKRLGWLDAYMAHHWENATWPHPRRQVLMAGMQYLRQQLTGLLRRLNSDAIPERLLKAKRHLHACMRYLQERKRPRNYVKHGLVKLTCGQK